MGELGKGRRRRRAVGPPGAWPAPADEGGASGRLGEAGDRSAGDERPPVDDDERLLRDVPPHHGT